MARVGMFDSGVGGLTVARELLTALPKCSLFYFGDTLHVPYGSRSVSELKTFAHQITSFLLQQGVQVIVDACNTTSSVALESLRQTFDAPIIGVVEPGVRVALETTYNNRIGILATEATIKNGSHGRLARAIRKEVLVFEQACPLFVPLVERGEVTGTRARKIAWDYLKPLQEAGVDTIILGCTHYPFLKPLMEDLVSGKIVFVDPSAATVKELVSACPWMLEQGEEELLERYFVSGDPGEFQRVASRLWGRPMGAVEAVNLDGFLGREAAGEF